MSPKESPLRTQAFRSISVGLVSRIPNIMSAVSFIYRTPPRAMLTNTPPLGQSIIFTVRGADNLDEVLYLPLSEVDEEGILLPSELGRDSQCLSREDIPSSIMVHAALLAEFLLNEDDAADVWVDFSWGEWQDSEASGTEHMLRDGLSSTSQADALDRDSSPEIGPDPEEGISNGGSIVEEETEFKFGDELDVLSDAEESAETEFKRVSDADHDVPSADYRSIPLLYLGRFRTDFPDTLFVVAMSGQSQRISIGESLCLVRQGSNGRLFVIGQVDVNLADRIGRMLKPGADFDARSAKLGRMLTHSCREEVLLLWSVASDI